MATHETIPILHNNYHFPIGDVNDRRLDNKVNKWLEAVSDMGENQFLAKVDIDGRPLPTEGTNATLTHEAAGKLCDGWDAKIGDGRNDTLNGYKFAMAFNNGTHYLPNCTIDLSEDLGMLKQQNSREYGRRAWESMEYYPNIHGTFQRLAGLALQKYPLYGYDRFENFKTGMALPFMFSWTTRMHSIHHNISL